MNTKYFLVFCILVLTINKVNSQAQSMDSTYMRFFAGSTFFMLGNIASSNKPDFVQLNFS